MYVFYFKIVSPFPDWAILSNIDGRGGPSPTPYNFAPRVDMRVKYVPK